MIRLANGQVGVIRLANEVWEVIRMSYISKTYGRSLGILMVNGGSLVNLILPGRYTIF